MRRRGGGGREFGARSLKERNTKSTFMTRERERESNSPKPSRLLSGSHLLDETHLPAEDKGGGEDPGLDENLGPHRRGLAKDGQRQFLWSISNAVAVGVPLAPDGNASDSVLGRGAVSKPVFSFVCLLKVVVFGLVRAHFITKPCRSLFPRIEEGGGRRKNPTYHTPNGR